MLCNTTNGLKWLHIYNGILIGLSIITGEDFLCLFVQIRHSNPSGKYSIVRMFGRHRGGSFGRQVVQLDSCDARM